MECLKKINYKKLSNICLIVLIILIGIITFLKVKIYIEDNKISNRRLYIYDIKSIVKNEDMESIEQKNIGCIKDNYIFQDYSISLNNLAYGTKPIKNDEIVVTKSYCEDYLVQDKFSSVIDKCSNDIIGDIVTIDNKKMKIVGILESRFMYPNIYTEFKGNNNKMSTLLVNDSALKEMCDKNDSFSIITFKTYKKMLAYNSNNLNSFYQSDVYIRDYMTTLYITSIILIIIYLLLLGLRRIKWN